jgi:hypothetical protein
MKFIIPKLNVPYRILKDIDIELWDLDNASWERLRKKKITKDAIFTLNSGSIIKITNWNYKHKRIKIRVVTLADKRWEKLCGYVTNDSNNFLNELEIEEITV